MKTLSFASLLLLVAAPAFAGRPGQPNTHELDCISTHHAVGVGASLEITTQALSPQYNVRGITLAERVVYPGAQPRKTELKQIRQDMESADFGADSDAGDRIEVRYEKNPEAATIFVNGVAKFTCSK
jgi:hypothetical protein